ncbi:MAG: Tim44 domain-containing protein [Proteobacteria bacterium]|nr:Tim44 domain-containing protein [Pseudomonadota bacterium]
MLNSPFFDVLLLAMIAGVILFRLYSVLGRRTGNERPPQERYGLNAPVQKSGQKTGGDNVVAIPDRSTQRAQAAIEKPIDPVARGLLDIKLADRSFDADHFIDGARHAYELIVTSFAAGDRSALRPLLNGEVFGAFDGVIAGREKRGEKVEFTFVGLKDAKIVTATLKGRVADITVSFAAQFISATQDTSGAVVEGDPKAVRDVTDIWSFERDVRAGDPNWTLVATSGEG